MKLTVAILTLNEIVGLRKIFDEIPTSGVEEIIAIDGGSTDGTIEFLESKGIRVHVQETRGRGEAFRLAFRKAIGDALIFFSPDGNEAAGDILKFRPFLEQGSDIVIGTRMVKEGHNEEDTQFFKWRKWANNAFTLIANLAWNRGVYVTDTINGFRAITRAAWMKLDLDGPGYTIEYQSSIRAFKLGLKISEFPTYEAPRIDGREGSPSIGTGIAFVKMFWRELTAVAKRTS
ncbi:MAG: glycosyltransferase family 2 protein [Proteobacteria bacterium]|nr:glycosyltransferase family 2 protein [Pseudomonadota bacterium]